jgi:transcriptional regulator with XRE-family HTH domain
MGAAGTSENRMNESRVTDLDQLIGSRIRLLRKTLQADAGKLAKNIGITYQQLQKYESGKNRISASKLWLVAHELNVPVRYFYQDYFDGQTDAPNPDNADFKHTEHMEIAHLIASATGFELFKCYALIKNDKVRSSIMNLIRSIVRNDEAI